MRFVIYIIIITFLSCSTKQPDNATKSDSLLWEISGNGLLAPSYIYGSMHYIPINDSYTPDILEKCFKNIHYVLLESNQDEVDSILKTISDTLFYLPNYNTYRNYLNTIDFLDFYNFLRDSLQLNNKKISKVIRLKPIFADRFIIGAYFGKMFSYDKYFYKLSKEYNKPIIGLDSGNDIIEYLYKYNSINLPSKFWVVNDSSRVKMIRGYKKTIIYYKQNKGRQLDSLMKADSDFELDSVIMRQRNAKWLPKIVYSMRKNSIFIVVGARHLGGGDGLLHHLKNLNYTLTPL